MKKNLIQNKVTIQKSLIQGYGCFAKQNLSPGEIIEECYTLIGANEDAILKNYYFAVGKKKGIVLGSGSIFNHSDNPNADYFFDEINQIMVFTAITPIRRGEEILTSYGKNWFASRQAVVKKISWQKKSWRYFKGFPLRALSVILIIYSLININDVLTAIEKIKQII